MAVLIAVEDLQRHNGRLSPSPFAKRRISALNASKMLDGV